MRYYITSDTSDNNCHREEYIGNNYEIAYNTLKRINKGYITEYNGKLNLILRENGKIFLMKGYE